MRGRVAHLLVFGCRMRYRIIAYRKEESEVPRCLREPTSNLG